MALYKERTGLGQAKRNRSHTGFRMLMKQLSEDVTQAIRYMSLEEGKVHY